MKNPKVDRRIRKTRDTLKRTLAELVREKDLRDITVRDITEKADLNRGTFYLHYKDVYDLMEKMEDDLIFEIQEMIDTSRPKPAPGKSSSKPVFETLLPMLDPIADYILDNREICASMFQSRVGSSFFPKFRELVSKNGAELIKEKFPDYDREIYDYYIAFISVGIQGQLQHWFDTGLSFPKKDLIKMVDQIITAAAVSVLA